jgi:hypothetical protein
MIEKLKQSSFNVDTPISSQVDEYGAIEVVFRRMISGNHPYTWPATKSISGMTLRFTGAKQDIEIYDQTFSICDGTYKGRAFTKNFITVEATVNTEKIESHPDFEDWAGTADEPNTDNAIWEESDGLLRFVQFKDDYKLAGITTYYAPEWTFSVTWMNDSAESAFSPGKKYALPNVPNFSPLNFQYLATSIQQEQNGAAWKITAQLLASENWNPLIYKT